MKVTNVIYKYHLIFLFLGILLLPAFNQMTGIWTFERNDENRTFKDSLGIDINHLDRFPKEAEEYVNDNFSFRTPLLDFYHHLKFHYFKVSPHPDKVLIGKDQWYFGAEKELDIYEGRLDFTEQQLADLLAIWKSRQAYFDDKGIPFYWMIAPFKHNIHEEFLPFNVSKSKKIKRVDQLKNYFATALPDLIIDPTETLLANKADKRLFLQLDNHWNHQAGELAAEQLMARIQADFPEEDFTGGNDFEWADSVSWKGIHRRVLGVKGLYEMDRLPVKTLANSVAAEKYGFPPIENFPYKSKYELRYVNENAQSKKTILFIRDSFGTQLIPFVLTYFQESVFIFDSWRYQLNEPIIDKVKPDIVVFLNLETHIENILEHSPKPAAD